MDPEAQASLQRECHWCLTISVYLHISQVAYYYNLLFLTPTTPIPYHTSILTNKEWVLKLLNGYSNRIWTCLGVNHNIFDWLVCVLKHLRFICTLFFPSNSLFPSCHHP
jgi:hypothetical protein